MYVVKNNLKSVENLESLYIFHYPQFLFSNKLEEKRCLMCVILLYSFIYRWIALWRLTACYLRSEHFFFNTHICPENFYRPQTKFAKVMFLHVCPQRGIIWAGTPQPPLVGTHPWADTPPPEQCMLGDTGNKRAVRILLECVLVINFCLRRPKESLGSATTIKNGR